MKKHILLIAALLVAQTAFGQAKSKTKRTKPSQAPSTSTSTTTSAPTSGATTSIAAAPKSKRRADTTAWRLSYLLWQEIIDLENGVDSSKMIAQSQGLQASYVWNKPFSGARWSWMYSADLGVGTVKGKGNNAAIPDTFANQAWVALGGSAGISYRTSVFSSVHLMVPLTYRTISWKLSAGSATNPSRDSSFSAGLTGAFGTQLSPKTLILFGFTHQQMWKATQWSISYQRAFL